MDGALRKRLALFCILLVVGVVAGASIVALGAEKAIPGTSSDSEYVSVVTVSPPLPGQPSGQQSERHVRYEARLESFVTIAKNDERVQQLLAEPRSEIVGVAVPRGPTSDESGVMLVKIDTTFYKIGIDTVQRKVVSVEERTCYGPGCNG